MFLLFNSSKGGEKKKKEVVPQMWFWKTATPLLGGVATSNIATRCSLTEPFQSVDLKLYTSF